MEKIPVIFKFRDAIEGNGFIADVKVVGRALLVNEYGSWTMNGVCPAGIAEVGDTPQSAYLKFRESFKQILQDIASDGRNFDAFQTEGNEFVLANDENEEKEWLQARAEIKKEKELDAPFQSLEKITEETPTTVLIKNIVGQIQKVQE